MISCNILSVLLQPSLQDFSTAWCCKSGRFCSPGNALTGAKACAGAEESSQSALPEEAEAPDQAARTRRTWRGSAEAVEPLGSFRGDSAGARVLSARQPQGRGASRASARAGLLPLGCLPVGARRRGRRPASPERHRSRNGRFDRRSPRAGAAAPTREPRPSAGRGERPAGRGRSERAAG